MRVISGIYKRRRFDVPHSFKARPTTDFAKENLFNVLSNYMDFEDGIRALDLFAGTGSISIELVSRGCDQVISVEKDRDHYAFICKIMQELKTDKCLPIRGDVFKYLKSGREQFDKTVTNKDIEGKWAIFFFYPADFTFVCPTELVDIAEKYNQFKEMGVEVYSVSTDSHFVHKAWHDASESIRKITYPMLADPTGALSRAFGVMIEEDGMAYRGTFVVNPEGKIKLAEIQDNSIGRNADELLRKVEAAQFVATHDGEVCPAKWKKGAETLKPSIDLVGKI